MSSFLKVHYCEPYQLFYNLIRYRATDFLVNALNLPTNLLLIFNKWHIDRHIQYKNDYYFHQWTRCQLKFEFKNSNSILMVRKF